MYLNICIINIINIIINKLLNNVLYIYKDLN